ncbi:MAG: glycosyltransferase family 2 protein [Thermodesulfobacteriota bacterium]|nr:glycosyltransferase family 2 protein [Thermodesulfobacteriota bacterium]
MKISFLISTFNGQDDIVLLLDSIAALEIPSGTIEVIIRDDNSSDTTVDIIKKHYRWVTLIEGKETLGFVKSNNVAFQFATGDIICCVNQDTILDASFLRESTALFEKYSEVVALNTNMIMPWIMSLDEWRSIPMENMPAYVYSLTIFGYIAYKRIAPVVQDGNFVSGGGAFIRRKAIGPEEDLFDAEISMYCEDTELSLRLSKRGRIIVSPQTGLYHNQVPKKIGSFNQFVKMTRITWNRFYVLAKHYTTLKFFACYPLFLIGIVLKNNHLGLTSVKKWVAYLASVGLVVPFFFLFPVWLIKNIQMKWLK